MIQKVLFLLLGDIPRQCTNAILDIKPQVARDIASPQFEGLSEVLQYRALFKTGILPVGEKPHCDSVCFEQLGLKPPP